MVNDCWPLHALNFLWGSGGWSLNLNHRGVVNSSSGIHNSLIHSLEEYICHSMLPLHPFYSFLLEPMLNDQLIPLVFQCRGPSSHVSTSIQAYIVHSCSNNPFHRLPQYLSQKAALCICFKVLVLASSAWHQQPFHLVKKCVMATTWTLRNG